MRFVLCSLLVACAPSVPREIDADFNGDGRLDHAVVTDERDGFRTTFAYLDVTLAGATEPETAKFKDGRWIWIDHARYPQLASIMRRYGY